MSFTVLFLCTGNYYRSRFAEVLFNALAAGEKVSLHAESRGLATELGVNNIGPLSPHALKELQRLGLGDGTITRFPLPVSEDDFSKADLIVALDEDEHLDMMRQRHPEWADRVEYWNVRDLWAAPPEEALPAIGRLVETLVKRLRPR
jgi:protein-tyrosine phosphatase